MIIGSFQENANSFSGHLSTLMLDAMLTIVPAQDSSAENAPDWRVLLGDAETGTEVGAGWSRTGERAGSYVALQIDDPALGVPLRANLIRIAPESDSYQLLWSRPAPRERA
ncbi:DUF736 domain-containing protein [Sphingopyxis sp. R3-92]|uniref:DUF736 domain-containing protein n=1 Tax=Sphingopyxis sp. R3-92 TaxID=3158553 RepID=UPI003EE577B9